MARLEVISVEDGFCRGMLEDLKQYASIPDDSRDAMLHRILRNAALRVQESADRPFLATTLKVTAAVPEGTGIIRLYMGGGDIVSCQDAGGGSVPFDPLPGGRLLVYKRGVPVSVTYTTVPTDGDRDALYHTVLRYATADYDGAETQELNQILTEARQ